MSSRRSLRGGMVIGKTFSRYQRSSRKLPVPDLLLQIAIGGGNNPGIDFDGAGAAQTFKFALLDYSQQLGLQFQGNSPISSRKMVAPSAISNRPRCLACEPVKAPFS